MQNREDAATVEAIAPLDPVQGGPLPPTDGQLGTAELVAGRSGQQVRVNASGLPTTTSSAYEVWLFGDDGRMVSLGTLADGTGSFTVPEGIDTSEYRTVDVSDELPDGNPAHSGSAWSEALSPDRPASLGSRGHRWAPAGWPRWQLVPGFSRAHPGW